MPVGPCSMRATRGAASVSKINLPHAERRTGLRGVAWPWRAVLLSVFQNSTQLFVVLSCENKRNPPFRERCIKQNISLLKLIIHLHLQVSSNGLSQMKLQLCLLSPVSVFPFSSAIQTPQPLPRLCSPWVVCDPCGRCTSCLSPRAVFRAHGSSCSVLSPAAPRKRFPDNRRD